MNWENLFVSAKAVRQDNPIVSESLEHLVTSIV